MLETCKKWTVNTSVVKDNIIQISLIIELNNIVRNNFPFQPMINKPANNVSVYLALFSGEMPFSE